MKNICDTCPSCPSSTAIPSNNTMLIYMQRPDATLVAGFQKWKNQFERHVKKGEHGITIIAPTPLQKED